MGSICHSGLDPGRLGEQQPKVATSPESSDYKYLNYGYCYELGYKIIA